MRPKLVLNTALSCLSLLSADVTVSLCLTTPLDLTCVISPTRVSISETKPGELCGPTPSPGSAPLSEFHEEGRSECKDGQTVVAHVRVAVIIHGQKHLREEEHICILGARDLGGQGSKRLARWQEEEAEDSCSERQSQSRGNELEVPQGL